MRDLTHVVVQTGFTGRLNEYMNDIYDIMYKQYNTLCECMFTNDKTFMPQFFIPQKNAEKEDIATRILGILDRHSMSNGVICFDVRNGRGDIAFDIIDILTKTNYCSVYSNVSELCYIHEDDIRLVVLRYDCADS